MAHNDPMMIKSRLMMQFYNFVELGLQSTEKSNHFSLILNKIHKELLLIEDMHEKCFECRKHVNNNSNILRSQVSKFLQTIQDPSRVPIERSAKNFESKEP